MGKLIIVSAPSGTGKGTVIAELRKHEELNLAFSVSATSRPMRAGEQDKVEYYFFSAEEFRRHIEAGNFLEWEEVYQDKFYGTLKSEVDSKLAQGYNVVFDIDYVGGLNIKKIYGENALAIFLKPPSLADLRARLEGRQTDSQEVIEERLRKAELELAQAEKFDKVFINDELSKCVNEVYLAVKDFVK